ncbi:MAG: hypothetical protein N2691_05140 [Patescibacteria group bacterium]|nr:hypothetical protein [Patescibacteria group bacterium]
MPAHQQYGGLIWTNHALERLQERKLPRHIAVTAYHAPDEKLRGKQPGTVELRKRHGKSLITLILKQNEPREWIVLSAWIDPPLPGTPDHRKREAWRSYRKAGFWGRLWYILRRQMGF